MVTKAYWLIAAGTFGVLWLMFLTLHRRYYVSLTRHRLFRLRAKLFNDAICLSLPHSHPSYVLVRRTLNGMIRYVEDLSLIQLATIIFLNKYVHKGALPKYEGELGRALHGLSGTQKLALTQAQSEAHMIVLRHIMSTSIVLWPITKPLSIVLSFARKTEKARAWAVGGPRQRKEWSRFDAEATFFPPDGAST